jgi:transcriptional regulator with XRE-family HTH domain
VATLIEEAPLEELRRLRKEKGWSQTRLAQESGVDRATINQAEGGRRSPTIATLEELATALGVEVADFFPKAQASLPLEEGGASPQPRVVQGEAHLSGTGRLAAVGKIMEAADDYKAGKISRGKLEEQVIGELVPA